MREEQQLPRIPENNAGEECGPRLEGQADGERSDEPTTDSALGAVFHSSVIDSPVIQRKCPTDDDAGTRVVAVTVAVAVAAAATNSLIMVRD
ncbi:hypothetical protein CH63R_07529 [Colletotrichum higginsianum IMI 349063]|uniref:Uncharacterized protein n=1 Tax=Colletotrichum higginsianum (strain IMI 349063) TaxID=759273 RepID=A0A1B7Y9V2_COLHI|nr:hypothetical protein CH63R_07529 [Colletotrichum higginsianum IMI 349063]OBR08764.1 hypothetical protein CH63R_07529 [Colletotrichum higginsianum IMI 349063]